MNTNLFVQVNLLSSSDENGRTTSILKNIYKEIQIQCTSAQKFREVVETLNTTSLEDAQFAEKFAIISSSKVFSMFELFGNKLQDHMVALLKRNTKSALNWMEFEPDRFCNSLTLLGEFYSRSYSLQECLNSIVVKAIFKHLNMVAAEPNDQTAKELVNQLILNGKSLYKSHPNEMDDLMMNIRNTLLDSTNCAINTRFLLVIEFANNKFNLLHPKLKTLYLKKMEKYSIPTKSCGNNESQVIMRPKPNTPQNDNYNNAARRRTLTSVKESSKVSLERIDSKKRYSLNNLNSYSNNRNYKLTEKEINIQGSVKSVKGYEELKCFVNTENVKIRIDTTPKSIMKSKKVETPVKDVSKQNNNTNNLRTASNRFETTIVKNIPIREATFIKNKKKSQRPISSSLGNLSFENVTIS